MVNIRERISTIKRTLGDTQGIFMGSAIDLSGDITEVMGKQANFDTERNVLNASVDPLIGDLRSVSEHPTTVSILIARSQT